MEEDIDWTDWQGRLTPCSETSVLTAFSDAEKIDFELTSDHSPQRHVFKGRSRKERDSSPSAVSSSESEEPSEEETGPRRRPGRPKGSSKSRKLELLESLFDDPSILKSSRRGGENRSTTKHTTLKNISSGSQEAFASGSVGGMRIMDFHRAAQYGQLVTMEKMLEKLQVDIDCRDADGNTALHHAALNGQDEIVKMLLKRGANTEAQNLLKETPANVASGAGDGLGKLIDFFASSQLASHEHPFLTACWRGRKRELRSWIESGTNAKDSADSLGNTGLHYCAILNHDSMAELLLKNERGLINVTNSLGNSPLHEACRFSSPDVVKVLLRRGADYRLVNAEGESPFESANKIIRKIFRAFVRESGIDDPELLSTFSNKRFVEVSADERSAGSSSEDEKQKRHGFSREERKLQQMLAIFGKSKAGENSLSKDVDKKPRRGRPPKNTQKSSSGIISDEDIKDRRPRRVDKKETAVTNSKSSQGVRLDPSYVDKASGRTQLHKFAAKGKLDGVKGLLVMSPKLAKVQDNAGYLALHEACLRGHPAIVKELIKAYPNGVNVAASNGDTPLHDAAENDHEDVIRVLLEAGADRSIKNDRGSIPADLVDDSLRQLLTEESPPITLTSRKAGSGRKKLILESESSPSPPKRSPVVKESGLDSLFSKKKHLPKPAVVREPQDIHVSEPLLQLHYTLDDADGGWYFLAKQMEDLYGRYFSSGKLRDSIPLSKTRTLSAENTSKLSTSTIVSKMTSLKPYVSTTGTQSLLLLDRDAVVKAFERAGGNLTDVPIIYVDLHRLQGGSSSTSLNSPDATGAHTNGTDTAPSASVPENSRTLPPKLKMKYWQTKRPSLDLH